MSRKYVDEVTVNVKDAYEKAKKSDNIALTKIRRTGALLHAFQDRLSDTSTVQAAVDAVNSIKVVEAV